MIFFPKCQNTVLKIFIPHPPANTTSPIFHPKVWSYFPQKRLFSLKKRLLTHLTKMFKYCFPNLITWFSFLNRVVKVNPVASYFLDDFDHFQNLVQQQLVYHSEIFHNAISQSTCFCSSFCQETLKRKKV